MSAIWGWVTRYLTGKALVWVVAGLAGAGVLAWFKVAYVPRHELASLERQVLDLGEALVARDIELHRERERAAANLALSKRHMARANLYERTMDAWLEEHRRVTHAEADQWRSGAVAGVVSERMRDIPTRAAD